MHPVLIRIGPLVIRWDGVMIALACLTGRRPEFYPLIQHFHLHLTRDSATSCQMYFTSYS